MPETAVLEKPLAILGEEDIILGLRALGFNTYAIKGPQELSAALERMMSQKPAVCLVQDNFYAALEAQISNHKELARTIFIPFSKQGRIDLIDNIVRDIRLRATGTF